MDLTNLVQTVAKFAPLLGSALPIPGGIGTAVGELIAHEFGGDISNPDDLASRIVTDPDAQVKLAEIEANTKVQIQQFRVQQSIAAIQADTNDRADARKNNVAGKSNMPSILTFFIIAIFFASFGLLICFANRIPENIASVLYMMTGTINTAFGAAFAYWLGSSESSRSKDMAIHKTLDNLSSNTN